MKSLSSSPDAITEKLWPDRPAGTTPLQSPTLSDPLCDTPMRVTLEQLRPYEHNPRLIRNPQYEEIKASIRTRGLDQAPPITRRPGESHFIIRNGGNTRLAILNELWQETRDERFFRIHCLFRPWADETTALLGHMAENDLHSPLTFIERALSVAKIKTLFQRDGGELSQSELARRLTAGGYPISQPHISRMLDTLEHLLPGLPQTLYAGLGKPLIQRLLGLRKQAKRVWDRHPDTRNDFDELWFSTLASLDEPGSFEHERLKDALLAGMSEALGQPGRLLAAELADTAETLTGANSRPLTTPHAEVQLPTPAAPDKSAHASRQDLQGPESASATTATSHPSRVERIRQQIAAENTPTEHRDHAQDNDLWHIDREIDRPERLREEISHLARELANHAGTPDSVMSCDDGLGFVCLPLQPLSTCRAASIHLLLGALLRAHDRLDWQDRRQLPAALFGQILLGVYQLPLPNQPPEDIGLERLPDPQVLQLFRLIRLARRLIELTTAPLD
ncbi:integrating conjugative element, PFGI_1 class, ParB family protein [Geopseudomonas sagittaria]|uniref:Integrating conjugative element, PFGI_1 class, ParB family protein n=1 Tax=Geopseudomonas sagittaria TaxID=1135990 RepID=A0A1I5XET7_9GAMM|nr:ParB family protein [Pseudomonas sagittaria]MCM2329712.1 ParB N-terminal domain-containing protein [Pseudomonas sagittaria]SFQ30475.1 integrating conjugative element, PFGI_1 class, ParB family protein [Pseudomonas sagittaria]